MKKTKSRAGQAILIVATMFIMACDDGQLRQENVDLSVSPASPTIISFYADPAEVEAGGSTVISWEVAGADSVEITSVGTDGSSPLHVESTEGTGQAVAANLSATTDFTLTAKISAPSSDEEGEEGDASAEPKSISISAFLPRSEDAAEDGEGEDAAPSVGGSTAAAPSTETITVVVIKESTLSASITADKGSVTPGESTIIRWKVEPEDATVEVVDSDSTAVIPTFTGEDCDIDDPQELLDAENPTETPQATGCAAVTPQASTVYTVTATSGDASESADVEVTVVDRELFAELLINGVVDARTSNFDEPVTLSWMVEPVDALVSVDADPPVISCTPELPEGQVVDYSTAECTVEGPTTFTLNIILADDGTVGATAVAGVSRSDAANADIDIRADEWGFEGEEVTIEIKPKEGTDASAIKEVRVRDADGVRPVSLTEKISVRIPHEGVGVEMEDVTGTTTDYGTRVRALTTISEQVDINAEAITALAFDPNNVKIRYTGIQMPGWNKGIAYIYKDGGPIPVDFGDKLKAADGLAKFWKDDAFDEYVKTFPVNTVAVRKDYPDEIYVGVTGALVVTEDGGKSFELVAPARRISIKGNDYDGSHPTCRGKTQTGVEAVHKNQLVSLNQICDIVVTASGRMIIATDNGAFAISDITAFRAKEDGVNVVGHPSADGKADEEGKLTYGHIVDDIECVDDTCSTVFAAMDSGVLKSEDGGETWTEFGSIGGKTYQVKSLGDNIYAATESDVYESDSITASWTKMGLGMNTRSLAIDKNKSVFGGIMLIAGTDQGVFVTRDSGEYWSPIAPEGIEESANNLVAIETMDAKSGGGKVVTVMLGTGKKIIYGKAPIGIVAAGATTDEYKEAMLEAGIEEEIVKQIK